jgi:glycosyltransferase involved in cell wall biosynthesis
MQPVAPPHAASRRPGARPRLALLGSRGIPARYGGFETFVEELAPRLVRRGVDVTVFCEDRPGPKPTSHRGVRLEYVRADAPGPLRTVDFDLRCLRHAAGAFDVVYLLGSGAAFGAGVVRGAGARLWINPGGLEWKRSKWGPVARRWLAAMEAHSCSVADRMVFDNAALAHDVIGRNPVRGSAVIPYGAPVIGTEASEERLAQFGVRPRAYDLVVCRTEPENQLLEIVRAHRCATPDTPLLVVAAQDTGEYWRRVRAAAGPEAVLLGTIYDQAILRPLRLHARLHLHGHTVGGTNPSLLEAMGAGNAVLAADNPYNREVLGPGGWYWADERELESALVAADAAGEVERRARGALNVARVRGHYDWEAVADTYFELLMEEVDRSESAIGTAPSGVYPSEAAQRARRITASA